MIGDYILYKGKIDKVKAIYSKNVISLEKHDDVFIGDIEPMPILKELIERLVPALGQLYKDEEGYWHFEIKGKIDVGGRLKYVHELQQVLRVCDYWNMANTFCEWKMKEEYEKWSINTSK